MIRITDGMTLNTTMANERRTSLQMANLTSEASSGKRVEMPSDDPTAYAQVTSANAQIARMQARSSSMTTAATNLQSADDALSSASDLLAQAKSVALEASNGSEGAETRANAAVQLQAIKKELVAIANTKGPDGDYLFGGTSTAAAPFDSTTGAFSGNAQTTSVEVADGITSQSNASGANAFTAAGGEDIFGAIDALSTALTSNNTTGITAGITAMDSGTTQVINERVNVGVNASRLQNAVTMLGSMTTSAQTAVATTQQADVASVYSALSTTQTAYQAAIDVNKTLMQTLETALTG